VVVFTSGCTSTGPGTTKQASSIVNGVSLYSYANSTYNFKLNKPDDWSVGVGDYIAVEDNSDNGITNVKIHPIYLSG